MSTTATGYENLYPLCPQPSAPPLETRTGVDWSTLHVKPKSSWFDTQRIRNAVGSTFLALGLGSAGATAYAGLAFAAAPVVVIGTFSGLVVLTTALTVGGIAMLRMKPSFRDPDYCVASRKEAGKDIEDNFLSYRDIKNKYQDLLDRSIISSEDLNAVFRIDPRLQNYPSFVARHGVESLQVLDMNNKASLKKSLLSQPDLNYHVLSSQYPEALRCGILTRKDIDELIRLDTFSDYPSFIAKHGPEVLETLDADNKVAVKVNLMSSIVRDYATAADKQPGLKHVLDRKDCRLLGVRKEDVAVSILPKEFAMMAAQNWSYRTFIDRNGTEALAYADEPAKNYLRDKLLAHIKNAGVGILDAKNAYGRECQALGIALETLDTPLFEQELTALRNGKLSYESFVQRNGMDIIEMKSGENGQLCIELRTHFLELPFARMTSPGAARERELYAIDESEIKSKILQKTQDFTVMEILRKYPEFFRNGTLSVKDAAEGKATIGERLKSELSQIRTLEELMNSYPNEIFTTNLIDRDDPLIQELVLQFYRLNALQILEGTGFNKVGECLAYIQKAGLEYRSVQGAIQTAKAELAQLKQSHERSLQSFNRDFHSAQTLAEAEKAQTIALARQISQIADAEAALNRIAAQKRSTDSYYHSLEIDLRRLESEYQSNQRELLSRQQRLPELYKRRDQMAYQANASTTLAARKGDLEFQIRQVENHPHRHVKGIRSALKALPEVHERNHQLNRLRHELKDVTHQLDHTPRRLHEMQLEIDAFSLQIPRMQAEIQSYPIKYAGLMSGLSMARTTKDAMDREYARAETELHRRKAQVSQTVQVAETACAFKVQRAREDLDNKVTVENELFSHAKNRVEAQFKKNMSL